MNCYFRIIIFLWMKLYIYLSPFIPIDLAFVVISPKYFIIYSVDLYFRKLCELTLFYLLKIYKTGLFKNFAFIYRKLKWMKFASINHINCMKKNTHIFTGNMQSLKTMIWLGSIIWAEPIAYQFPCSDWELVIKLLSSWY